MNRRQPKASRADSKAPPDRELAEVVADIDRTRAAERCYPRPKPKRIGELLPRLLANRGYAQIQAAGDVAAAWQAAVGPKLAPHTRVGPLRAGTLNIVCNNTGILQELLFQKDSLLARINEHLAPKKIKNLRLKSSAATD